MRVTQTAPVVRSVRHPADDRPFIVIWEATRACALACRHCRASAVPTRDPLELSTAEADELMEQVASFGKPPPILVITGGDPFERPDLPDLIRRGREHGLPVAVSPSGTPKLNRESMAVMRDAGVVALSLSIDGSTAAVHDGFRGVEGTFARTVESWQTAREMGIKVQINTTVTSTNVHQLPEIVSIVRRNGAMTWSAFMLVPTGRGAALGPLTASQVEDVMNFLYDVGHDVPVRTTEGHHFRRVVIQRQALAQAGADHIAGLGLGRLYRDLTATMADINADASATPGRSQRRPPININAASGFVFISHHGTVHPSGFLTASAGNVRTEPITEIYRNSDLFTGLRNPDLLGGRCGVCEYRAICGGSRSRAFAVTGDAFAEDPLCAYVPGTFPHAELAQGLIDALS